MITFLQAIDETELIPGERDCPVKIDRPPIVGDQVSLGLETRWTIFETDLYQSDSDLIWVAHCAVDVQAVGVRSSWFQVEWGKEREINLQLFFCGERLLEVNMNLVGRSPQVGKVLTGFDVPNHETYPLPWQVASVQEYKPISEACYTAIYLAECKAVDIVFKVLENC